MPDRIPESRLAQFLSSKDDGVFIIGHASALVRLDGRLIAFDPVWDHKPYGNYWTFYPPQIDCSSIIEKLDLIVVSHIHEDHLSDKILSQATCPVLIMSGRPQLADRIRSSGRPLFEAEPHQWVIPNVWGDGSDRSVWIYFVPHSKNSIDSSCFAMNSKTMFTVYHGNDNFLELDQIKRVKKAVQRVDVAMIPYAFIHWYPHLVDTLGSHVRSSELKRLNWQHINMATTFAYEINPRLTIPFGASLYYAEDEDHPLNRGLTNPYDLCPMIDSAAPFHAGDWILDTGAHSHLMPRFEFMMGRRRHFDRLSFKPEPDENYVPTYDDLERIQSKALKSDIMVKNHYFGVNDRVWISLEHLTVGRTYNGTLVQPSVNHSITHFHFEGPVFARWARGEITFEQAIGTRRFRLKRSPEEYNLHVFEFMNKFL